MFDIDDIIVQLIIWGTALTIIAAIAIPASRITDRFTIINKNQIRIAIKMQLTNPQLSNIDRANTTHAIITYNAWLKKNQYWKNTPIIGWFYSSKFNKIKPIIMSKTIIEGNNFNNKEEK